MAKAWLVKERKGKDVERRKGVLAVLTDPEQARKCQGNWYLEVREIELDPVLDNVQGYEVWVLKTGEPAIIVHSGPEWSVVMRLEGNQFRLAPYDDRKICDNHGEHYEFRLVLIALVTASSDTEALGIAKAERDRLVANNEWRLKVPTTEYHEYTE